MADYAKIFNVTPVIVCGAARSGTRMVTDILNAHPEVAIQDEMHAKTMEAYFAFLKQVQANFDHYSHLKGRRLDTHWLHSQKRLHHIFFAVANKREDVLRRKAGVRYHGIKTPGYERYFGEFEVAFEKTKPFYIYCLRDVGSVWRSWLTREFTNDLDIFRRRYVRSLRQAIRIRSLAPDRFILFDLDAFVSSTEKDAFAKEKIFERLKLAYGDNYSISSLENTNSAQALGLQLVDSAEIDGQVKSLRDDKKIRKLANAMRNDRMRKSA